MSTVQLITKRFLVTLVTGIFVLCSGSLFAQHRNAHPVSGGRGGYVNHGGHGRGAVVVRSSPGWRYGHIPRRGVVVTAAPRRTVYVTHGGVNYGYHHGVFYRPYGSRYIVTAPPFGVRIRTLPVGYSRIVISDRPYYYYYGTYYVQNNDEYEVSPPPVGAIVESIPDDHEIIQVNGETYYKVNGVQYKAVEKDGEIWYEVIKVD